ncbi:MAG: hypothetical protein Q9191_006773, partial [Dirinaria sp. TL-2023a]
LETQLEAHKHASMKSVASPPCPRSSSAGLLSPNLEPLREHGAGRRFWDGIHTSIAQSSQTQSYGPSSAFYFIGRMSSYLDTAFQQAPSDHLMHPNSASRAFASPTSLWMGDSEESLMSDEIPLKADYLTRSQEEYFLGLFWQSYHCTMPILDESRFREHYKSLWVTSGTSRKPSALADIILAICMQYGIAFLPRSHTDAALRAVVDGDDATIAGRWFYRRCQILLTSELESPSITTLQCQILSVAYLCNASFQNMAHSALALAVRTAHILGLHLEPADGLPQAQKEFQKQIWWTVFAIEIKTCMKLGRPFSAQISQVTCTLPRADKESAVLSGSNFASFNEDVTWLTYGLENTKLILAARAIYVAFFEKCANILDINGGKSLYNDSESLESCAEFLLSSMRCLQNWLRDVPDALRTKRKGPGQSFSTDRSALEVDPFAPVWLQRQRLMLELLYHNLTMNLYRPFICFSPKSNHSTPLAERNAISCVNHAIAMIHIIHQILTETDIMSGWHEVYQWQWNATLSMIGFILAYPVHPSTPSARKAINSAIDAFESFGENFAMAASAANVTRNLLAKADLLIDRFRTGLTTGLTTTHALSVYNNGDLVQDHGAGLDPSESQATDDTITLQPETSSAITQDGSADSMGLVFTVDSFNSFEPFWADSGNLSNTWAYT